MDLAPSQSPRQNVTEKTMQQQQPINELDKSNMQEQKTLSVTDKIRMMLSTPKPKKKLEDESNEKNSDEATIGNAVEDIIDNMYKTAEKIINEDPDDQQIFETDQENIPKPESPQPVVEKVPKLSRKEKMEMIKQLPSGRQEEFKAYGGGNQIGTTKSAKSRKQSSVKKTSSGSKPKKSK